jgi:hypothetical protein
MTQFEDNLESQKKQSSCERCICVGNWANVVLILWVITEDFVP